MTILSGTAVVFGGCGNQEGGATVYDDVYTLDLVTWVWSKVSPLMAESPILGVASPVRAVQGDSVPAKTLELSKTGTHRIPDSPPKRNLGRSPFPSARWRHTAVAVDRTKVLIFGGSGPSRNAARLNDLWVLELKKIEDDLDKSMSQSPSLSSLARDVSPEASGELPLASEEGLHLHIDEDPLVQWSPAPASGKPPAPRSDHTVVFDGTCMWLFGGYGGEGQSRAYLSDLVCLAPSSATADDAPTVPSGKTALEWTYPECSGSLPRARSGHSASMMGRSMIVAGGRDQNGIRSDAFILNLDTVTWSLLRDYRMQPGARSPLASRAESRATRSEGGVSLPASAASEPPVPLFPPTPASAPSAPSVALLNPLCRHLAAALDSVPAHKLFVFGGQTAPEGERSKWHYSDSVSVLDCGSMLWMHATVRGDKPSPREDSAWAYDAKTAKLVLLGGWNDAWLDDLYTLDVAGIVGPPYAVQSVDPVQGPITGGTLVRISGLNFGGCREIKVKFTDSVHEEVVEGQLISDTEIECRSPVWETQGSGEVDVRVALDDHIFTVNRVRWGFFVNTSPSRCVAYGPGLAPKCPWGMPALFKVQAKDSTGQNRTSGSDPFVFEVICEQLPNASGLDNENLPGPEKIPVDLQDNEDGTYSCSYIPSTPNAKYTISIKFDDPISKQISEIRGSPWTVHVDDPWIRIPKVLSGSKAPKVDSGVAVAVQGHRAVLWGGEADRVHVLDMVALRWDVPEVMGAPPIPRQGHSLVRVDNETLLMVGGMDAPSMDSEPGADASQAMLSQEVWALSGSRTGWKWARLNSVAPTRAALGGCVLPGSGRRVVLCGGSDGKDEVPEDAYSISTVNLGKAETTRLLSLNEEKRLPSIPDALLDYVSGEDEENFFSQGPQRSWGRKGHCVAAVDHETIVVLGGSPVTSEVTVGTLNMEERRIEWRVQPATGKIPSPRTGFALYVREGNAYIYGGVDEEGHRLDELFMLDTKSWVWHCLYASNGQWMSEQTVMPILMMDSKKVVVATGTVGNMESLHVLEYANLQSSTSVEGRVNLQLVEDLSKLQTFVQDVYETLKTDPLSAKYTGDEDAQASLVWRLVDALYKVNTQAAETELMIDVLKEGLLVLQATGIKTEMLGQNLDDVIDMWKEVKKLAPAMRERIAKLEDAEATKLREQIAKFWERVQEFCGVFKGQKFFKMSHGVDSSLVDIARVYSDVMTMWGVARELDGNATIFGCPELLIEPKSTLQGLVATLKEMRELWSFVQMTDFVVEDAGDILWELLDVEMLKEAMRHLYDHCGVFFAEFPASDVLDSQRARVKNLNVSAVLIAKFKSPTLRDRHWSALKHTSRTRSFDHNDSDFKVKTLLALNLHNFEDDVLEILNAAERESEMESGLEDLASAWAAVEFVFEKHKDSSVSLARMSHDDMELLESHQLKVQLMMASRYLKSVLRIDSGGNHVTFGQDVQFWQQRLSTISEVIQVVGECQRIWSYLEAIYLGASEVQLDLQEATEDFKTTDMELRDVLVSLMSTRNVSKACSEHELVEKLHDLQERLERSERALLSYLESKRVAFPRFFFVATADLLDMISNASTPEKVIVYFSKIVNAVDSLDLEMAETRQVTGWSSSIGVEKVQLHTPFPIGGRVEAYTPQIVDAIADTLRSLLRTSMSEQASMPDSRQWMLRNPSQIVRVTRQILFTSQVEAALASTQAGGAKGMKGLDRLLSEYKNHLGFMVGLVRSDLGPGERAKVVSQVTMELHAITLLQTLVAENVTQASEFKWRSQLKCYWSEETLEPTLSVFDAEVSYAYEYAGNGQRLVVTPLTDRIYITALLALQLNMGCSPTGNAGTGKTESIKELAVMLGKCIYVFNCSPELDYKSVGDIFKGLGASGSWGFLVEFNRLAPEVLSVCSSQFSSLLSAVASQQDTFRITDSEMALDPTCGLFATMNPGQFGRSELPQTLRLQLRPVTATLPDSQMICEHTFMSHGFHQAKVLAYKLTGLFSLSSQLLSKSSHFDWGLRAMTSILKVSCARRFAHPQQDEQELLFQVVKAMTVPKIFGKDQDVFHLLLRDVFPDAAKPTPPDAEVEALIADAAAEEKLTVSTPFVLKAMQIQQLLSVQHSVIIMGESGTGKSALWKALARASTLAGSRVTVRDVNPKAMTTNEFYGHVNLSTREWKDGIFSMLMRELANAADGLPKWIVLDGNLDANWAESINSLMDGNKVLTLASNERIYLNSTMSLLFEARDLKHASPSTVSRAGVVYVPEASQWECLVASWLAAREDSAQRIETVRVLIEHYVPVILHFVHKELQPVVPVLDFNLVQSLTHLLDALLTFDNIPKNAKDEKTLLETYFVFACIWTFGGCLNIKDGTDCRRLFSNWWKASWTTIRMPQKGSVFEHFVLNGKFAPWATMNEVADASLHPAGNLATGLTVMTNEMTAVKFIAEQLILRREPVMIAGPAGVGKTALVRSMLTSLPVKTCFCQLNYYTDAASLQDMLEGPLEKKAGKNYGPVGNRRLVYFVDDVNLPRIDEYGAQSGSALLRQHFDYKHWYDRTKLFLKVVSRVQYVACMNPARGSFVVNPRLQRHFHLLAMDMPGAQALTTILSACMRGQEGQFDALEESFKNKIIQATMELHRKVRAAFRKTAECFHYEFNLRQLVDMFKGIVLVDSKQPLDHTMFTSLWAHEAERSYSDALTSRQDAAAFQKILKDVCKRFFKDLAQNAVLVEPLIFCDMWNTLGDNSYFRVDDLDKLWRNIERGLAGYNEAHPRMNLVLFDEAVRHIARITRILRIGHGLLVGVGGSGRQSATRLAAHIEYYTVFEISLSTQNDISHFEQDVKMVMTKSGVDAEGTVLLFSDANLVDDRCLVLINELLSTGTISKLFDAAAVDVISESLRPMAKSAGVAEDKDSMYQFFLSRVKQNLRVVMAFSPVGDALSHRAVRFPALVNCTTIDWFHDWSEKALLSVATRFVADLPLDEDQRDAVIKFFPMSFAAVNKTSEDFLVKEQRYNHTTPKSFLELISLYTSLLDSEGDKLQNEMARLDRGMDKLLVTSNGVSELEQELQAKSIEVDEKRLLADNLMDQMGLDKMRILEAKKVAELEAAKCEELAVVCAAQTAECEAELELALPSVRAAEEALDTFNKKDLVELKSMPKPPHGVEDVTAAILALKGKSARDWAAAKLMMKEITKFVDELRGLKVEIDEGRMVSSSVESARQYFDLPHFSAEEMRKKSKAAAGLVDFAINIVKYYEMVLEVEPRRDALRRAQEQYDNTKDRMQEAKDQGEWLQHRLSDLQSEYHQVETQKALVTEEAKKLQKRLGLAQRLMAALGAEQERWQISLDAMRAQEPMLAGDLLLSAAFVAYMGGFSKPYRDSLVAQLAAYLTTSGIRCSAVSDPLRLLVNSSMREMWKEQGLPDDQGFIENAAIMQASQRYPLIIDPQHQGTKWLRSREGHDRNLVIEPHDSKTLKESLAQAIQHGWSLMVDHLGETLNSTLFHLVGRQRVKNRDVMYEVVGDQEVEYNPSFRLFLVSKLNNPHFAPEHQAECTLVNFCVTASGLEEQLLSIVVQQERPEFEQERMLLIRHQADFKQRLADLEEGMLQKLADAEGTITEDVVLIEALEEIREASTELEDKVDNARENQAHINKIRERFRPVALRGALLHQVVEQLYKVHPFYRYSMESFTLAFIRAIDLDSQKAPAGGPIHVSQLLEGAVTNPFQRVRMSATMVKAGLRGVLSGGAVVSDLVLEDHRTDELFDSVTWNVFRFCRQGLFKRHRLLLAAMLAFTTALDDSEAVQNELRCLFSVKSHTESTSVPIALSQYVSETVWGAVVALQHLPAFSLLSREFETSPDMWLIWRNDPRPETIDPPGKYSALSDIQRMLLVRAVRPDRIAEAMSNFVRKHLGEEFVDDSEPSMLEVYRQSRPTMPILFFVFAGSDLAQELQPLLEKKEYSEGNGRFASLSMGQGQEAVAEQAIHDMAMRGGWVLLQNVQMSAEWLSALDNVLENLSNVHADFRLFLSMETPPDDQAHAIPMSILSRCVKVAAEPPSVLQTNLRRAWESFDESFFEQTVMKSELQALSFGLCVLHSLLNSRKKFSTMGWSRPYSFCSADLWHSAGCLLNVLESDGELSFAEMRCVVGEVIYGGHVTDIWDQRICMTYVNRLLSEEALDGDFAMAGLKLATEGMTFEGYLEAIGDVPDSPEAYGMHANAEVVRRERDADVLIESLSQVFADTDGAWSLKPSAAPVTDTLFELLEQLPANFNLRDVRAESEEAGASPFSAVLLQECARMNALLAQMRSSLSELRAGVDGLLNVSDAMEALLDCLRRDVVPATWSELAYDSLKPLGAWFIDLLQRIEQLAGWSERMPSSVWIGALFHPAAFITALKQATARQKGWPLERMGTHTEVLQMEWESPEPQPQSGVHVHGFYLEGAAWDARGSCLRDQRPKEPRPRLPVVLLTAVHLDSPAATRDVDKGLALDCPVFYSPRRGPSYVFTAQLRLPPTPAASRWVTLGVALVMAI